MHPGPQHPHGPSPPSAPGGRAPFPQGARHWQQPHAPTTHQEPISKVAGPRGPPTLVPSPCPPFHSNLTLLVCPAPKSSLSWYRQSPCPRPQKPPPLFAPQPPPSVPQGDRPASSMALERDFDFTFTSQAALHQHYCGKPCWSCLQLVKRDQALRDFIWAFEDRAINQFTVRSVDAGVCVSLDSHLALYNQFSDLYPEVLHR